MAEIEDILWDFLRGVRQGSFRDDAILVKSFSEKIVMGMEGSAGTPQSAESIEERGDPPSTRTGDKVQASTKKSLTNPRGSGKTTSPPPPITPTPPTTATTDKNKKDTSDQQGERDTGSTSKPAASIAEFGTVRKQKQKNLPSPPTRGEFFIWFPFEEFGDLSVSDGILKFFLDASRPAGNPLACNLTVLQVAKWYVWKLSLGAFSRYTPRGHTRGVQTFWANLGKWNTSGLEELEEAAVWCRRVGTAGKLKHVKRDREIRDKLHEKGKGDFKGPDIPWEEF